VQQDVLPGEFILVLIPVDHVLDLSAIGAAFAMRGLGTPVPAELLCLRVVAHMTGLNDHQILAMSGIRTVSGRGDDPADPAMIERKGAEVFGNDNDRVALTFIGTEGTRGHDFPRFETQRLAPVVQARHKQVITHHHVMDREASSELHRFRS
jgi:hypothetical protein